VRTKLLKLKPNILDEAGPLRGSGDVGSCNPSNPLRFLCSSVFQRSVLDQLITGDHQITRFLAVSSVVRYPGFLDLLCQSRACLMTA
jgi:hypothetical protein